jgi:pimeloyl-ACP methyl ester carboxylesterase
MMYPLYDFGGSGDILHVALANGFPPQTYAPMLTPFITHYHVVNLMPRALWDDAPVPEKLVSWKNMVAGDLHAGIVEQGWQNIIAIGHSFGGIATLLTAIKDPKRFKAVVLLDPTILPRPYMKALQASRLLGRKASSGLAERAEKRKIAFDSVDVAYDYFKGKKLFADWDDSALRGYAQSMKPAPDGGVTLAWKREWEAYYFRTLYAGTWGDLSKLRGKMPLLMVRGGNSDTLFPQVAKAIQKILPDMTYHEVEGHGHLFPQSAPHQTAEIIQKWLAEL